MEASFFPRNPDTLLLRYTASEPRMPLIACMYMHFPNKRTVDVLEMFVDWIITVISVISFCDVYSAWKCFNWAPRHECVLWEWRYSSTHSWPRYYMEMSGQLHPQGKRSCYPLDKRMDGPGFTCRIHTHTHTLHTSVTRFGYRYGQNCVTFH
jgi:hypothetical protein